MKSKIFIVLALILSILFISSVSFSGIKEDLEKSLAGTLTKGSDAWKGWEDGLLKEHGLVLNKLAVSVNILDQQQDNEHFLIFAQVTITAFAFDKSGIKKRFIRQMVVAYLIAKKTSEISHSQILDGGDTIIGGWNGQDC